MIIAPKFLKKLTKGRVFSVQFKKKNGDLRLMAARFGVKKGLVEKSENYQSSDNSGNGEVKEYITVFEMKRMSKEEKALALTGKKVDRYKRIITANIISIKVRGVVLTYSQLVEKYMDYLVGKLDLDIRVINEKDQYNGDLDSLSNFFSSDEQLEQAA